MDRQEDKYIDIDIDIDIDRVHFIRHLIALIFALKFRAIYIVSACILKIPFRTKMRNSAHKFAKLRLLLLEQ